MGNRIAEKYPRLSEACNQYQKVVLSSAEERGGYLKHSKNAKLYVKPKKRAEDGFIAKFCL